MSTPGDKRADAAWAELQRRMGHPSPGAEEAPPSPARGRGDDGEAEAPPLWLWVLCGFAVAILCGFVLVVVWPLVQAWLFFGGR